jgi:hypothetical protein
MPPPPIPRTPRSKPPPLPKAYRTGFTIVYAVFALLFILTSVVWAFQRGLASGRGTPGFAFGMVQGSVVIPLGLTVGIACFWRRNRNLHMIVRILFWAAAFLVFTKINQLVNHR